MSTSPPLARPAEQRQRRVHDAALLEGWRSRPVAVAAMTWVAMAATADGRAGRRRWAS
ncbi:MULTISPECIES: hypothetical protein [unclassified Nocardia]|uniref:hypothetical protein n=1 Tax=unclassified Nocardia TaxID=2637762 RepID=UPI00278C242A|nr:MULTISPECIES: hypothetical protein [unclassified Nocardia]